MVISAILILPYILENMNNVSMSPLAEVTLISRLKETVAGGFMRDAVTINIVLSVVRMAYLLDY
jgi:hypothetical protein